MTERVGDADDFAAMFGSKQEPQPDAGPDAEQRRAIAARHGLAPELGDRLRGETPAELEADAAAVAALAQNDSRRPEPVVQTFNSEAKAEWARGMVELLHPPREENES